MKGAFNGAMFRRTHTLPCLPSIFGRIGGNCEKRKGNLLWLIPLDKPTAVGGLGGNRSLVNSK